METHVLPCVEDDNNNICLFGTSEDEVHKEKKNTSRSFYWFNYIARYKFTALVVFHYNRSNPKHACYYYVSNDTVEPLFNELARRFTVIRKNSF